MSRDKLILSGVVLLALLGFLVYQQAKKDDSLGKPQASSTEFPTISAPEDIDKLSVTNGDKGEVVLEKVGDPNASLSGDAEAADGGPPAKWVMTKPFRADANQSAVKDLIANLKDLKISSQVNLVLDDSVRKDKQLDPGHAVHVMAWKGGDKKIDELFGKSGAAGELVMVDGKPNSVWAAKGYSSYLYSKETKDFRERAIFKFDEDSILQIGITNAHGAFSFSKTGDKWLGTFGGKPLERFDQEKAKDLLRAFKGLNADDFGDGKSLAETGLDKPDADVTVQIKGDSKTYDLAVGKVSAGTNHWAKRADDDTIYQITSYVADLTMADSTKFQLPVDAGAADSGKLAPAKAKK